MFKFEPNDLRPRLEKALAEFETIGRCDFFDLAEADEHAEVVDQEITQETKIESIWLNDAQDGFDLTVREFLEWCEALAPDALRNRTALFLHHQALFHVTFANDRAAIVAYRGIGEDNYPLRVRYGQTEIVCSLCSGATPFSFAIAKSGDTDEDYGVTPWSGADLFVRIAFEGLSPTEEELSKLADAYLFELSVSAEIDLKREPYPSVDYDFPDRAEHEELEESRLRPLATTAALSEGHALYLQAIRTDVLGFQIITFTKVLEFVSATVTRWTAHGQVRQRLLSPEALRPDARYIQSLVQLVQDQQVFRKDSEAIRLTVQTCSDAVLLAPHAPEFLRLLKSVDASTSERDRQAALNELSDCISATRNQLAHAKANYQLSGKECPEQQLLAFSKCLRTAAIQTIRWLEGVPPEQRVS